MATGISSSQQSSSQPTKSKTESATGTSQMDQYLNRNYNPQGTIQSLSEGLQFYSVGSPDSGRGVLIISDLFGWDSGHIRKIADYIAHQGFYVMIPGLLTLSGHRNVFPDLFDFSKLGEYMRTLTFDSVLKPRIQSMVRYCESVGVNKLSILSYSWGSWVTARALADPELGEKFTCAAVVHPDIGVEETVFGGNAAELMSHVMKPMLIMPTKDCANEYRMGGAYVEPLKHRLKTSEVMDFPELSHGFFPRGTLSSTENCQAINRATTRSIDFFNQHAEM